MDAASVAASLAAAVVSPPAAAVVAVVPPPPHPARDITAMETASANDKVRFLIKLFLLHLIGSFSFFSRLILYFYYSGAQEFLTVDKTAIVCGIL